MGDEWGLGSQGGLLSLFASEKALVLLIKMLMPLLCVMPITDGNGPSSRRHRSSINIAPFTLTLHITHPATMASSVSRLLLGPAHEALVERILLHLDLESVLSAAKVSLHPKSTVTDGRLVPA